MGAASLGSRAIIGTFYETLRLADGLGWQGKIATLFNSNQESETYKWLGMSPTMREWIGQRLLRGLKDNGLSIINKTFESTLEVFVDDLRRDKTDQIRLRIKEMADRTSSHWASLISTLINSNGTAYDGVNFFANTHSEGDSGTLKNALTSTEYTVLDVATAASPTPSEMADALMAVIGHFYTFKDDVGEPFNELSTNFLVMVPVNLWGATVNAVSAKLLNTGSGARDNPLNAMGINIDVVVNPRLTSTTKFFVFRTDGRVGAFIKQEEVPVKVSAVAEGSEEEFKHNRHLYGVTAVRNVGFGMWQHAIQATLS